MPVTTQERFTALAHELDSLDVDDNLVLFEANHVAIKAGHVRALARWLACRPRPKLRK